LPRVGRVVASLEQLVQHGVEVILRREIVDFAGRFNLRHGDAFVPHNLSRALDLLEGWLTHVRETHLVFLVFLYGVFDSGGDEGLSDSALLAGERAGAVRLVWLDLFEGAEAATLSLRHQKVLSLCIAARLSGLAIHVVSRQGIDARILGWRGPLAKQTESGNEVDSELLILDGRELCKQLIVCLVIGQVGNRNC
jgi:hypothetical protein